MSLGTSLERLWLRALPPLTRDYLWVSVDGFHMYGARQHHVMLYWLLRGKYERHTRALFEEAIEPGMRVLDIGAHIGWFTLLAARATGPAGSVYAFEPDPANYRFLCHNVALNGLAVVTTVPNAVADASGVRPFFADMKNSVVSSLWAEGRSEGAVPVQCTTVDEFLAPGEKVDVVKLDVEGGEVHALRGMRRVLGEAPALVLVVECNPTALATAGASVQELLDELAALELDASVIDERERCLQPVTSELLDPALADGRWYANLYCVRG